MRLRPIPHNPNSPPLVPRDPSHSHWVRTILLGLLLAIIAFLLRDRSPANVPVMPALALPGVSAHVADDISPHIVAAAHPLSMAVPTIMPIGLATAQVRALLMRFNDAFRRGRSTLDASVLEGVATGTALAAEQQRIAELRAAGAPEQWTLLDMQIASVSTTDNAIRICTSEHWELSNRSGSAEAQFYIEQYTLVREGDTWLVDELHYLEDNCLP